MGIYNSAPTTSSQDKLLIYVFIVVIAVIVLILHVAQAKFLNKFCELSNEKKSFLSWIPIVNLYFLGKVIINEIAGVIATLLCIYSLYVYFIKHEIMTLNLIVIICMYIYAFILYLNYKRTKQAETTPKMSNVESTVTLGNAGNFTNQNIKEKKSFFKKENPQKEEKKQEEPVETYSTQPMQAPKPTSEENTFTPKFKPTNNPYQSNPSDSSLQDLYNRK